MGREHLLREIERFRVDDSIEAAATPPASWYTHPELFELERRIFRTTWQPVARLDQLESRGSYVAGCVMGEPFVVVRADDDSVRAFHNVCRHHAAEVVTGEGVVSELSCPYHGWTYGLDGGLKRAPRIGGIRDFDKKSMGLAPMATATWGPFVFVRACEPDGGATSLAAEVAPLDARLRGAGFAELRFVARRSYTVACNWKVYVDNYLDGGYHVPHIHHGLGAQLDLDSYRTEIFERVSIQGCSSGEPATAGDGHGDFAARVGAEAIYGWLYPGFMVNRYGPIMDTNTVRPLAPDRTEVIFDYYFEERYAADPDGEFVTRSLGASDAVQREDEEVCVSVQRGLLSSAYDTGRYAPRVEQGEFHFHQLLARDLRSGALDD